MATFESKLNADAQQCILQFLSNDKSIKAVSKSFKEHMAMNQIRDMRSRRESSAQNQALSPFEGTTWIVDPNRDNLTEKEIQNGFEGPSKSLVDAMKIMESGDKVLLCEGHHEWFSENEDEHVRFGEDECLYIEGVGECYLSFTAEHESAFYGKLSVSNVHIREDGSRGYTLMEIWSKGSISFTDCIIDGINLGTYDESSLNCIRCMFTDKSNEFEILGENRSSLTFVDCQFEMNRIPNEVVPPDYWQSNGPDIDEVSRFEAYGGELTMQIIGCTFSSRNIPLNPLTNIQGGINKETSSFQYNKFVPSGQE